MNRSYVLCDIDHVLADSAWREPLIEESWDAFHAASEKDEPVPDMVRMIGALFNENFQIIGLTTRPEKWRQLTQAWLVRHCVWIDEILMRPYDSFAKSPELKVALAVQRFGTQEALANEVALVLDDREDVIEAFRALGVTALQVHVRRS